MTKKRPQLGQLAPRYRFFLNPYKNHRFTNCPGCDRKTKVRKHPFFIHVDPTQPILLNMSGRYCPKCDILILHQDKVEELLTATMTLNNLDLIGNDYLIVGTLERQGWQGAAQEPLNYQRTFENLHDFKEVITVEARPAGWYRDEE